MSSFVAACRLKAAQIFRGEPESISVIPRGDFYPPERYFNRFWFLYNRDKSDPSPYVRDVIKALAFYCKSMIKRDTSPADLKKLLGIVNGYIHLIGVGENASVYKHDFLKQELQNFVDFLPFFTQTIRREIKEYNNAKNKEQNNKLRHVEDPVTRGIVSDLECKNAEEPARNSTAFIADMETRLAALGMRRGGSRSKTRRASRSGGTRRHRRNSEMEHGI